MSKQGIFTCFYFLLISTENCTFSIDHTLRKKHFVLENLWIENVQTKKMNGHMPIFGAEIKI